MSLFDEAVEHAKRINPDFDENNVEDLDTMTKAMVLSNLDGEHGKRMYEDYLEKIVEVREREGMKSLIEKRVYNRQQLVEARLRMLQLEKDIAEHRLKVLREFMD